MNSALTTLDRSFNVAIKNVRMYESTYGVAAHYDVFIDGVRAFYVDDEANGGAYRYCVFVQALFDKFKSAVDSLPEMEVFNSMMKIDVDMALALIHDAQLERSGK